jgi:hypothetical protein
MNIGNSPRNIAAVVDAAAASYEASLRRRTDISEADIAEEMWLYRHYVTKAYSAAADEFNEWVEAGRWLQ